MEKEKENLIKFNKPYKFEGAEYNEVDLSGLEDLTVIDLAAADKQFYGQGNVSGGSIETNILYTCIIASKATGKPIEFFENLPVKLGMKVKLEVMSFLLAED